MTAEDIKKMIAEALGAPAAEKMIEAEEAGRAALHGKSQAEQLATFAKSAPGDLHRGAVARGMAHDPLKGKGTAFVRFAKAVALAKHAGRDPQSVAKDLGYGSEISDAFSREAQATLKALSEGSFADGGVLVPEQISSDFIELLRARTAVLTMGASTLQFKGTMSIPRQTSAGSASYVGEMSNIPVSSPQAGEVRLSAKKLAALYVASNDLLRNPSAGAEALLRDDMIKVMALKKDLTVLRSVGGEYAPKGVRYWANSSNVNAITGTALANKVTDFGTMIRLVEESNVGLDRGGFILRPRTKWNLATTLDSQGNFVFMAAMMGGNLFGFPFATTTQVPANLGGGSNETECYFGQWSELIIGEDTAMQVEAFPNGAYYDGSAIQSGISQDSTPLRALERHDVIVRNDTSFSVLTGVTY